MGHGSNPHFPPLYTTTRKLDLQITIILYVPSMDFIVPHIEHLGDNRIRIDLYSKEGGTFLGMLYYERAKNGFLRKPIGLKKMACVDAKIETLFNLFPQVEPKDVLDYCQSLLMGGDKDTTNIWFHQRNIYQQFLVISKILCTFRVVVGGNHIRKNNPPLSTRHKIYLSN